MVAATGIAIIGLLTSTCLSRRLLKEIFGMINVKRAGGCLAAKGGGKGVTSETDHKPRPSMSCST